MKLDDLILNLKKLEKGEEVIFSSVLEDWKINDKTVHQLDSQIDKFRDFYWPEENKTNLLEIPALLYDFQKEIISNIDAMTMNEKLYHFSLFDRFNSCKNNTEEEIIYKKLLAKK